MSRITRCLGTSVDREGNPCTRYRVRAGKADWLVTSTLKPGRTRTVAWRVKGNGSHSRNPEKVLPDGGVETMCAELLHSPLEPPRSAVTVEGGTASRVDEETTIRILPLAGGRTMEVGMRGRGRAGIVRMRVTDDADGSAVIEDTAYGWETLDAYLAWKGIAIGETEPPTPLSLLEGELAANGLSIRDVRAFTRHDDPVWATGIDPQGDTPGLIAWTDRDVWFTARDGDGSTYFDHVPRNPRIDGEGGDAHADE